METVQGYVILKAATFETGHGFALGHNPGAPSPFVTWQFTEGETGHRDYYWGRYGTSQAWAQRDFDRRVDDYQQLYHAAVKHTELGPEGVYRYYSTQRPVDIGTYPKLPDNQYKMPDDLLAVCTVLHEEAGEGTVRVVFEPDFNLIVRQYDASFELVLDRDMVLTYQGSNTVSTDALTEQEIEDETKILQIITQMDLSLDQKEFYRSLREMNAEYIVLSSSSVAVSYVETAGCIPVREVEGHIIFRVEEK